MSARARNLLIVLIATVAAAVAVYWFFVTFHQVPFELRTPPAAEARRNRLLALERTLQARGLTVFNNLRFNTREFATATDSAIVLDMDPRHLRDSDVDALLVFVEQGALLLMRMPATADGRAGALLDRLGVEPLEADPHCFDIALELHGKYPMCGGTRLGGDIETQFTQLASYDDSEYGYWFGHADVDGGHVYLVSELDMLHNAALDEAAAVEISAALLAPLLERQRIHLFRGIDVEPFHVLIVRRGWPALVPAAIALLLWLWMRSERFGPKLPDIAVRRRALLEHVRASGEFLFRRGKPMTMHRALLTRVQRRIDEREPVIAALSGAARDAALAERTGLAAAAITQAMNPVGIGRPETFFATLSTLIQLERRL